MSPVRTRRLRWPFVWLLIVQQFLAGAGIPLPCPPATTGSGERYPCEHCGCGCRSAEQCWAHCCCFSNQEKLAWARQNGVAVPQFVVAAAAREADAVRKPMCPHCHCRGQKRPAREDRTGSHDEQGRHEDGSSDGVYCMSAMRCQGLTQQWQVATVSWPCDRHAQFCLVLLPCGRVQSPPLPGLSFSPSPPPTPPPNRREPGLSPPPVLS